MKEHKKEGLKQLAISLACMGIGIFLVWLMFMRG